MGRAKAAAGPMVPFECGSGYTNASVNGSLSTTNDVSLVFMGKWRRSYAKVVAAALSDNVRARSAVTARSNAPQLLLLIERMRCGENKLFSITVGSASSLND